MAIGRSEDRNNPSGSKAREAAVAVRDPIRGTHLGQRSYDRTNRPDI